MRTPSTRQLLNVGGISLGALGSILLLVSSLGITAPAVGGVLLLIGWALLCVLTIGERQSRDELKCLRADLSTHEARQLDRTRRIESAIEAERAKESRHEYVQEQALERIENKIKLEASSPGPMHSAEGSASTLDAMFITSNGAGLGHLTRLLAIAGWLKGEYQVEFLTLSRAYRQAAGFGFSIRYFPSNEIAGVAGSVWNSAFHAYLMRAFAIRRPRIVVFDGTVVYEPLVDVCRGFGIPLIWVQRGCWKAEADERYPIRRNAARVASHVIIPGDFGCTEHVDVGAGVRVTRVAPILLAKEEDLLSASDARRELSMSSSKVQVLVNLGGGILADSGDKATLMKAMLQRYGAHVEITTVRSPLDQSPLPPAAVNVIKAYPVYKYYRAFDLVVTAAGYNSIQELVAFEIPMIVVPNLATQTDNQLLRARGVESFGMVRVALDQVGVLESIGDFLRDGRIGKSVSGENRSGRPRDGAREAARVVADEIEHERWRDTIDFLE